MSDQSSSVYVDRTQGPPAKRLIKSELENLDLGKPVKYENDNEKVIVDSRNDVWKIVGEPINHPDASFYGLNGYRRERDSYYWPADPTIPTAVHYCWFGDSRKKLPPSVEALAKFREQQKQKAKAKYGKS